ncbi:MAG: SUMF1/EgtB/PvdO family nonheme iron enzyme [Pseudomonadota bacterium]
MALVAFCRWLSARTAPSLDGDIVRLPTEWEWQWAAQGGDQQRPYPWGEESPDEARLCCIAASESGGTTPVGLFPDGVSRDGLVDMLGNIWEWCLNDYDDPATTATDAAVESRTIRGGSWLEHESNTRCAVRGRLRPDNRNISVGFRVCRCSPS